MSNAWGTSWSPARRDTWGGSWGGTVAPPFIPADFGGGMTREDRARRALPLPVRLPRLQLTVGVPTLTGRVVVRRRQRLRADWRTAGVFFTGRLAVSGPPVALPPAHCQDDEDELVMFMMAEGWL